MSKPNDGGPVFPQHNPDGSIYHQGESLRAKLAGMAMRGLIQGYDVAWLLDDDLSSGHNAAVTREKLWKAALAVADTGISELEKDIK